jgi:hypothetical protein
MKKVLVKGPGLSLSGYGEQTRFALRSLANREDIDLYFINIPWGKTGHIPDTEQKEWMMSLVTKTAFYSKQTSGKPSFDVSVQVTIPNEFEKIAPVNIGYTAGIETTKVSPQWIEKSNAMTKLIVPSKHSKTVFEETVYKAVVEQTGEERDFKLTSPVEVCAFPASKGEVQNVDLHLSTDWNFLSVAQWGPRKNVEATINNFLQEFKDQEVGLVLKLNITKNSTMDRLTTEQKIKRLVDKFREQNENVKCKVYLLHGSMTDEEMRGLYRHPQIKAFVTTTHGEGFGLPLFEAAIAELPIVAPAWSSYVDFLYAPKKIKQGKEKSKPHFTKIDFDLKNVQKEAVWNGVIQKDSKWCFVKEHSVRNAMREVFKNYGQKLSDAKKLSKFVLENFNEEKQLELFSSIVSKKKILIPEEISGISFCIPTNGKRTEKTKLTIESIKKQNWQDIPYEIIVCGDVEMLANIDDIVLLDKKEDAHSRKVALLRNEAAKFSKYNEIAFCDDDVILDPKWLDGVKTFSEKEGWYVLGNKVFNPDGTRYWDRSLLNPHTLVDYKHSKEDQFLYQSSAFFLVRKEVFEKVKWDETKLVYADREGEIPEDVQYSLDLISNKYPLSFNENSLVWHNDDSYTEVDLGKVVQTLKKDLLMEKVGFEYFLPEDSEFTELVNGSSE